MLGPIQNDEVKAILTELEEKGLESWWAAAVKVTADAGIRKWSYLKTVIENCLAEGHPPGAGNGRNVKKQLATRQAMDYIGGEFADFIQH